MREPPRAVDANVLLRYLLDDVPEQSDSARRLIDSDTPLGLTAVVLAELAWTLRGPLYRHDRAEVARVLAALVARANIMAVGFVKAEALAALATCAAATGAADFGDALIAACARSEGITEVYSFDARFARAGLMPIAPG
jgi:predicted nucleic acid-binding protein